MKKNLLNALVFQIGWFLCVLGGNLVATIYTALALVFHHYFIFSRPRQWIVLFAVATIGCLVDIALVKGGIITFADADILGIPLWLVCLWILFATTFEHCLGWLRRHPWLAMVLAAVLGPSSYWFGAGLSGATISPPLETSLAIMAMAWALLFPAGIYFANQPGRPR